MHIPLDTVVIFVQGLWVGLAFGVVHGHTLGGGGTGEGH